MGNTKANTQEVKKLEPIALNVKVSKVILSKLDNDRIGFVTDKTFEIIDSKTGERKEADTFRMNVYNATSQVAQFVPYIQLAEALAMGAQVNPQILALVLTNADMEIVREFHAKDEEREGLDSTYSADCWVTTIKKVTPHIEPLFIDTINALIANKPAIVKAAAVPNPFGA